MGWQIGYDSAWDRDVGYGVPCVCDHPECDKEIDRGLAYVCGGEPYGGYGCGLFFCEEHLSFELVGEPKECVRLCECCAAAGGFQDQDACFSPKPDTIEWIKWKLTDESWKQWRDENPEKVEKMKERIK